MHHQPITRATAMGLAVAALAAPSALAGLPSQDLRSPDARDAALVASGSTAPQDLRSPDARDAALVASGSTAPQDLRSPDSRDAAAGRGTFSAPDVTVVKLAEPAAPAGGLDWGDAGLGAAVLFGVVLLGFATTMWVGHRRRRGPANPRPATSA